MARVLKKLRRQRTLSGFLHHPVTDFTVMVLIVASVALLVVEETFELGPGHPLPLVSEAITAIFAVELTLRYIAARKKGRFFRRYWPDLLALLPLLRPLRIFRMFRLFRLFHLGMLLDRRVSVLSGVLRVNFYLLWALLVLTAFLVVGSAVMAFLLEGQQGAEYSSLPKNLWWAAYSIIAGEPISTDGMPRTTAGRLLVAGMMLSGMTLFAIFTGVVSATMMARLQGGAKLAELDIDELEGHVLVCGWNTGTPPMLSEMAVDEELRGLALVLVNELERLPDLTRTRIRADLLYHVRGDFTQLEVLKRAGVEHASRAVVMADQVRGHASEDRDARSVLAALTIERLNPDVYCVVELMDADNQAHLEVAGVEAVIMRSELSGRALAAACRHPNLMEVMMNLLTLRRGETIHRVQGPEAPMRFDALMPLVKDEHNALLIGVERPRKGPAPRPRAGEVRSLLNNKTEMIVNPRPDLMVRPDDWLILIGAPNDIV